MSLLACLLPAARCLVIGGIISLHPYPRDERMQPERQQQDSVKTVLRLYSIVAQVNNCFAVGRRVHPASIKFDRTLATGA